MSFSSTLSSRWIFAFTLVILITSSAEASDCPPEVEKEITAYCTGLEDKVTKIGPNLKDKTGGIDDNDSTKFTTAEKDGMITLYKDILAEQAKFKKTGVDHCANDAEKLKACDALVDGYLKKTEVSTTLTNLKQWLTKADPNCIASLPEVPGAAADSNTSGHVLHVPTTAIDPNKIVGEWGHRMLNFGRKVAHKKLSRKELRRRRKQLSDAVLNKHRTRKNRRNRKNSKNPKHGAHNGPKHNAKHPHNQQHNKGPKGKAHPKPHDD